MHVCRNLSQVLTVSYIGANELKLFREGRKTGASFSWGGVSLAQNQGAGMLFLWPCAGSDAACCPMTMLGIQHYIGWEKAILNGTLLTRLVILPVPAPSFSLSPS